MTSHNPQLFSPPGRAEQDAPGTAPGADARALHRRSVVGGISVTLAEAGVTAVGTARLFILARLLAPSDFGVVGMVLAFTCFQVIFRESGFGTATLQSAEIDQKRTSGLFWIDAIVGAALAAILMLLAGPVSHYYQNEAVHGTMIALASLPLLDALVVQPQALLRRQMTFRGISAMRVGSVALSSVAAVFCAISGLRHWSLVIMHVTQRLLLLIGLGVLARWRPAAPWQSRFDRGLCSFGIHITAFNTVTFLARNLDKLILGRIATAAAVGMYTKSHQLMMLPSNGLRAPLTAVALSAMSRLRHDPVAYERYYRQFVSVLALALMPISLYCVCFPELVVRAVLGPDWLGAVPMIAWFAVAALLHSLLGTRGLVMLSAGHSRRYAAFGMLNSLTIVGAFAVGAYWKATGMAAAYALAEIVFAVPLLRYAFRGTPITLASFGRAIAVPALWNAGLVAYWLGCRLLLPDNLLLRFAVSAAGGGAILGVLVAVCREQRRLLVSIGKLALRKKGAGAGAGSQGEAP